MFLFALLLAAAFQLFRTSHRGTHETLPPKLFTVLCFRLLVQSNLRLTYYRLTINLGLTIFSLLTIFYYINCLTLKIFLKLKSQINNEKFNCFYYKNSKK